MNWKDILRRLFWSFVQGASHAALGSTGLTIGNQVTDAVPPANLATFGCLVLTSGGFNFAKQLYRESQRRLKELGVTDADQQE